MLRALSVCAPLALLDAHAAPVDTVSATTLHADIPAQSLAGALKAFSDQTGLQFIYVSALVANRSSHAVSAGQGVDEALAGLLEGTGLRFDHLTPSAIRVSAAPPALTRTPAQEQELSLVVVEADRLQEDVQSVPVTIQTLTGAQLQQSGVTSFNQLLRYTPAVTYSGNGPATGNIFMRGLGSVSSGNQSQATTAPFPNVALYLDHQSMQFPSRNNDVYLVDMERVEIFEGPQATLFGGGAEAGAIRYVTHKPGLDSTSGEAFAGYGTTAGGGSNSALSAVLNLPLVPGRVAVRAVVFSEDQGGYIANVPSTISYAPGTVAASTGAKADNAPLVARNTNPVHYQGARLSVLWKFHEKWDVLLQQNYQDMQASGYFYAYPRDSNGAVLAPDQIAAFTPAFTKDRYESTAWTLTGETDLLSVVYAGSFMVRHIEGQQDYSNYLRSSAGSYYGCIGPGAGYFNPSKFDSLKGKPLACYPPVADWNDTVENQHQSHDLRFTTPERYRVRGVLGAFWEKFVIFDQMSFNYLAIPQCDPANLAAAAAGGPACLSAVGPFPGSFASDPGLRENMNNAFGQDTQRGYKQQAFFGSVDVDLVPDFLTLTAGTRRYRYDEFEYGSEWFSESSNPLILNHPNGACTAAADGSCGFPIDLSKGESGFSSRASLAWHITPDIMTFYTYSQGFRPGGFNRTPSVRGQPVFLFPEAPYCGAASSDPRCARGGSLYGLPTDQYTRPIGYSADTLSNNELGIKSELLSHRLLVNASMYWMKWNNVQSQLFDLSHFGTATFIEQGPSYDIRGLSLQLVARVAGGFSLQGAGSWSSSSQSGSPCLRSTGTTPFTPNNPTPAGQCITVVNGAAYVNPWDVRGSSLPYSPASQFSVQGRYDLSVGRFKAFLVAGVSHIAAMHSTPQNYPDGNDPAQNPPMTTLLRYAIPGATTCNGSLGLSADAWTAQFTGSNLTNAYGPSNINAAPFIRSEIPLRPRVLMGSITYRF
ncbi:MAG: TonB-dependent receptor [Proteobacteria bacterium]|nr:TonB-dependent receptor [Pseudomonadota bacterium]